MASPSGDSFVHLHALENIELNGKPALVIDDVELDDAKTYELLGRGDTLGVFQLDGGPMRALLRAWRPPSSTTSPRWARSTGPARWANAHNDYADRKNKRQEVRALVVVIAVRGCGRLTDQP